MNIKEYISSGIVESYVLGLASAEERNEFERMSTEYPEVLHARTAFELALEKMAIENSIVPAPGLKEKILAGIIEPTSRPVVSRTPVKNMSWLKYAAAACLLLLAGSLYMNYDLQKRNRDLQDRFDASATELAQVREDANLIQNNPAIKMTRLDGQAISPTSFATVYWDTTSRDVYLMVNNLPAPATHEQYQLWALLDGKPIDMGMLEITQKPLQLYRMKNAQAAQAFAITLEKKGGNPTPTMEKLYVMGKL